MAKVTFSSKWGRVKVQAKPSAPENNQQSAQDTVREIKKNQKLPAGEDYREKSLAIHGLVCARCGREFDQTTRHLLTVHHKDGNHHYNPPDGSNWENLCAYCHEDVHSRSVLAEYLGNKNSSREAGLVYSGTSNLLQESESVLAQKLRQALQKKN